MTPGPELSGGEGGVGVWLTGVGGLERENILKSYTVSLYIVSMEGTTMGHTN